jgi:probable lipoprotein NlpC
MTHGSNLRLHLLALTLVLAALATAGIAAEEPVKDISATPPSADRRPESLRKDFIESARSYLGTPYVRGGTTAEGMDCSGLVYRAALECTGEAVPRTVSALAARSARIKDAAREPGDLLFFNTVGRLTHVGIYLGGGTFIHSASDGPHTGVIVSSVTEEYWARTYAFAGRIFAQEEMKVPDSPETTAPSVNPFPFSGNLGFRLNLTGSALWDFLPGGPVRGGEAIAELTWAKDVSVYPGIGAGICWDGRYDSLSFPFFFSLALPEGFRAYVGTQIHLTARDGVSRAIIFPSTLGISWTSKPAKFLGQNLRFYQGIDYSWHENETIGACLRFSTGLTLVYDL